MLSTMAAASVYTDQPDYTPGSVVTISGGNDSTGAPGYVEGNTVDVAVSGPNGWTSSCSATVAAGGSWSCTVTLDSDPDVAVGSYSYTATSTDAAGNPISESGTFADAVNTTTTVTSSLNPSVVGQSVTFTATVTKASDGTAVTAGTVTFGTGNCNSLAVLQAAQTVNGSGQVAYMTSALLLNTTIRACYSGTPPASTGFGSGSATVDQVVNATTFTFSLSALPAKTFGDSPFSVASYATTNSTGAVTFALAAASTGCTVDSAGMVTITGVAVGTDKCKISASLAADSPYIAQGPITQEFNIAKATPTFDFDLSALPAKTFGDSPFSVASYVTTNSPGAVTFAPASGSASCTVISAGVVTITGAAGQCKIDATLAATANYLGASATDAFNIAKATPTFTFNLSALPAKTVGDASFNLRTPVDYVTTNSPGAVTFALAAASTGCTVDAAGTVTIAGAAVGADKCKITATLAATANYLGASATDAFNIAPGDTTAPTAAPTQSPTANGAGWNNSDVTVTWHWTDNAGGSGIDSGNCTTSSTSSGEGTITLNATCKDLAGNTGNASYDVKIDKVAPSISASALPVANANGWNNTNVTVSYLCTDGGSGVDAGASSLDDDVLTASGTGTGTCVDKAGNSASDHIDVLIDKVAPSISASALPVANANGWNNTNVTVHFTCADTGGSGIAAGACPENQVLSTEGAAVSSSAQTVTDAAGNTSDASNVVTVKIDKTKPVVTVTGVINGATYTLGSVPVAGCTTTDALSGVKTAATVSSSGEPVGSITTTCAGGEDNADNTNSASVTYSVIYNWTGFFQPVDNDMLNVAKAGSAIPVKFNLGGNQGLNIFAAAYPRTVPMSCSTGEPVDDVEETVNAGGSSLTYGTNQYIYVWKTEKGWVGTCRQLQVKLNDGTTHTADFKFK